MNAWLRFRKWLRWLSIELLSFIPWVLYPRYWFQYKRERRHMIDLLRQDKAK